MLEKSDLLPRGKAAYLTAGADSDWTAVVSRVPLPADLQELQARDARELLEYATSLVAAQGKIVSFYRQLKMLNPGGGPETLSLRAHPDFMGAPWYDWIKVSDSSGSTLVYFAYRVLALFGGTCQDSGRETLYVFAEKYTTGSDLVDVTDLRYRWGSIGLPRVLPDRCMASRFAVLTLNRIAGGLWTTPSAALPGQHWVLMY